MENVEKIKMLTGEKYHLTDSELLKENYRLIKLLYRFNKTINRKKHQRILKKLLGGIGEDCVIFPRFHCEFGSNIFLGKGVFINVDGILLDANRIELGDHTMLGPRVQLITINHCLDLKYRGDHGYAKPVIVGKNVWIGAGSIVLPGVTIGSNSILGAGSVVTKDIPENVIAVGNPCKVIKSF